MGGSRGQPKATSAGGPQALRKPPKGARSRPRAGEGPGLGQDTNERRRPRAAEAWQGPRGPEAGVQGFSPGGGEAQGQPKAALRGGNASLMAAATGRRGLAGRPGRPEANNRKVKAADPWSRIRGAPENPGGRRSWARGPGPKTAG